MARYKVTEEVGKNSVVYCRKYTRVVEADNEADAIVKFNKELISLYGKKWFLEFASGNVFDYTKVERMA